jgi:hypothetical protein
MVRDHNFGTFAAVHAVHVGTRFLREKKAISPYRDEVDVKIDSALDYEPCIFHHDILPRSGRCWMSPLRRENMPDIEILEAFYDMEMEWVPADSLLREFIG